MSLVSQYLHLNRPDDAKATAQKAQARNFDPPFIHAVLYRVDFLQNDAAGMEREVAGLMGKPGFEDLILYQESDTAAWGGRFVKARELTRRAENSAQHADQKETAASYEAEAAVREALVGNKSLATQQARVALSLSNGRDVEPISSLALALAGDPADAMRLATDLAQRFSRDTWVQSQYLPMIRAADILGRSNASKESNKAIKALEATNRFEQGSPPGNLNFSFYPAYLRAEALLAAHQGHAAAAEFQKLLEHPGVVANEPIGPLAHLGLARAYILSGDATNARTAYKDFFALWKDADSDVPVLKQAKAEYAKLQ
jgi:hypothetical protein